MSLAELIDPGTARFRSAEDVRAHAEQFLTRGALAVEPLVELEPLAHIEVHLTLGDEQLYDKAIECEVVVLQPHRAVLRMLSPPSDLVARVLERAAKLEAPAVIVPAAPAPVVVPEPAPAPVIVPSPPPAVIVPAAPDPPAHLEMSLNPFDEVPSSGLFSEPSFEELVPSDAEIQALSEVVVRPRPQFNVTSNLLKFGSPDNARANLQELRDTAAFWGECLRIPTPGPAKVTLDVQGRTASIAASVFPGPQGGAIVQPNSPLEALERLESIIEPPPGAVWDVLGERPLRQLADLADFLGQPLVRQPELEQMQNPTLPLILRALIKHPGQFHVRFALDGELAGELYTDQQRAYSGLLTEGLTRAAREANTVTIVEHTGAVPTQLALATSLTYILGASLNRQLDLFSVDELAAGLAARTKKRIGVTPRASKLLGALGLPDPFRRAFSRLERHQGDLASYTAGTTRFAWAVVYILELNAAMTWK